MTESYTLLFTCDLRHLCDVKGWDFAELDRQAYDHYTTEKTSGGLFV